MKITDKFLTVDGKRVGIRLDAGPWVAGVPADLIKVRPKSGSFPASFKSSLSIENRSDMREDYFEHDCIRLMPGHPLYEAAKAAA